MSVATRPCPRYNRHEEPHMPPPNPVVTAIILEKAGMGLPVSVIARLARLKPSALQGWVDEGDMEGATPEQLRFTRDYHEARAKWIATQHGEISSSRMSGANEPNVSGRLALLERLVPEYARPEKVPPPVKETSPVAAKVAELSPETRKKLHEALKDNGSGGTGRHL